jgi:hypothetical protein
MKLHVHLGVHKTATTYLQVLLARNMDRLNQAGVGMMPLAPFRSFFTRDLMQFPVREFRIEDHLDKFFEGDIPPNVRGLVLSDENIIGLCNGLIATGKPYMRAAGRLNRVRRLLSGHKVTLFLSVRSYAGYTSSAYCEAMRHTDEFIRFDTFRSYFDIEELRWPRMLQQYIEALQPAEVKLWRFEDFRQTSSRIARELAFGTDLDEEAVEPKAERPSFSGAAVDVLETLAHHLGPMATAGLVESISETLPKASGKTGYPPFDPWTADEHREMAALYDADCASIPAKYWLIPPGSSVGAQKKRVQAVA